MDFSFLPRFSTGVGVVAAAGAASVANADVRLSARILAWANQRWVSMWGGDNRMVGREYYWCK